MTGGYASKDASGATVEAAALGPFTNNALGGANLIALATAIIDATGQNLLGVDANGRVDVNIHQTIGGGQTLQYGVINTATPGDNQLVAAQGGSLRIYVVSYLVVVNAAQTVQFKSGASALTGPMAFGANAGADPCGSVVAPLFATAANAALNLNLASAVQVSGHYGYFVAS